MTIAKAFAGLLKKLTAAKPYPRHALFHKGNLVEKTGSLVGLFWRVRLDSGKEQQLMFLPQNIRYLRKQRKMSQEELAQQIGLNRGNIASYENGSAEPRICNLLKLCDLFRVSVMELTNQDLSHVNGTERTPSDRKPPVEVRLPDPDLLQKLHTQSEELSELFKSIHTCCHYSSEPIESLPRECQTLLVYFEQLYDAAQALLCNHQSLLQRLVSEPESKD